LGAAGVVLTVVVARSLVAGGQSADQPALCQQEYDSDRQADSTAAAAKSPHLVSTTARGISQAVERK